MYVRTYVRMYLCIYVSMYLCRCCTQAFLIRLNWNRNSAYPCTIPILPNYVRNGTESQDVTQLMYACMLNGCFCGKISYVIGSPFPPGHS